MKKLLYIPIIHSDADLGSLSSVLEERTASVCGKRWQRHKEILGKFWEVIAEFLYSSDASRLKIYQDGLPVDGEVGRRIVEEGAKRGSQDYQIILNLLSKGAEIRKTEAPSLLKEEYKYISQISYARPYLLPYLRYKYGEEGLTAKRDRFIAQSINETLKEGEIGVLFIGCFHNVLPFLSKDIIIREVKEIKKVREYFILLFLGRDESKWEELSRYLISPIEGGAYDRTLSG